MAAALLSLFSSAFAEDVGWPVFFNEHADFSSFPRSNSTKGAVVYDSGPSFEINHPWDSALISGFGAGPGIILQFARSDGQGHWSNWKTGSLHIFPQGRFWAKISIGSGPGALRVRAVSSDSGSFFSMKVIEAAVFIHSPEQHAVSTDSGASYQPVSFKRNLAWPKPVIHSRREWHARRPTHPYTPSRPHYITIHHTAGIETHSLNSTLREVRFIQDFQMNGRGWWDIGYHFLIDSSGHIIEGRPENVEGSHTEGFNKDNLGIALMGDYNPPVDDHLSRAQMKALVALVRYLSYKYQISPSYIKGHRDYDQTACPGDEVYALLPRVRELDSWRPPLEFPNQTPVLLSHLKQPILWDALSPR